MIAGGALRLLRRRGPRALAGRLRWLVRRRRRAERAVAGFRARAERAASLDAAIDLAFTWEEAGIVIRPLQIRSELRSLVELLQRDPPRVVLEVGTGYGGTAFLFCRVAAPDALVVSVDRDPHLLPARPLLRTFPRAGQTLRLLRGDSGSPLTAARVRRALAGRPVDLLVIDGDHTAAAVRRDWATYAPLVRGGGLAALHDIVPVPIDGELLWDGVPDFWRELRSSHATGEIVESWSQGGGGFGLVWIGGRTQGAEPLRSPV